MNDFSQLCTHILNKHVQSWKRYYFRNSWSPLWEFIVENGWNLLNSRCSHERWNKTLSIDCAVILFLVTSNEDNYQSLLLSDWRDFTVDRKITVLSEIVEFGMKCHMNGGAFKLSLWSNTCEKSVFMQVFFCYRWSICQYVACYEDFTIVGSLGDSVYNLKVMLFTNVDCIGRTVFTGFVLNN